MEQTLEQRLAQFEDEAAQKWAAHHRVVNVQPRTQADRIDHESRERIGRWAEARKAELGITESLHEMNAEANAAETDQPEPEPAPAPAAAISPGVKA